jgi:hypothetical protein
VTAVHAQSSLNVVAARQANISSVLSAWRGSAQLQTLEAKTQAAAVHTTAAKAAGSMTSAPSASTGGHAVARIGPHVEGPVRRSTRKRRRKLYTDAEMVAIDDSDEEPGLDGTPVAQAGDGRPAMLIKAVHSGSCGANGEPQGDTMDRAGPAAHLHPAGQAAGLGTLQQAAGHNGFWIAPSRAVGLVAQELLHAQQSSGGAQPAGPA